MAGAYNEFEYFGVEPSIKYKTACTTDGLTHIFQCNHTAFLRPKFIEGSSKGVKCDAWCSGPHKHTRKIKPNGIDLKGLFCPTCAVKAGTETLQDFAKTHTDVRTVYKEACPILYKERGTYIIYIKGTNAADSNSAVDTISVVGKAWDNWIRKNPEFKQKLKGKKLNQGSQLTNNGANPAPALQSSARHSQPKLDPKEKQPIKVSYPPNAPKLQVRSSIVVTPSHPETLAGAIQGSIKTIDVPDTATNPSWADLVDLED